MVCIHLVGLQEIVDCLTLFTLVQDLCLLFSCLSIYATILLLYSVCALHAEESTRHFLPSFCISDTTMSINICVVMLQHNNSTLVPIYSIMSHCMYTVMRITETVKESDHIPSKLAHQKNNTKQNWKSSQSLPCDVFLFYFVIIHTKTIFVGRDSSF